MRLKAGNVASVCIDIQSKLFPLIDGNEKLEQNTIKLIDGLKILNIPIIVTEQYSKGLGSTIESVVQSLGKLYEPIDKNSFSCCGSKEFMSKLRSVNRNYIILFGIEAHVCVLQTAIDLAFLEFVPIIIRDCISSRDKGNVTMTLDRVRFEGGFVSSMESILFELLETSGTKQFKAISNIIK